MQNKNILEKDKVNSNQLPKRQPICMKTMPVDGPSNFIVKCFELVKERNILAKKDEWVERTTIFWMNQKGEFLESAAQTIWENCLKNWQPKQPVILVPANLVTPAIMVAKKIKIAVKNNFMLKPYILEGKEVIDISRVKRDTNTELCRNKQAMESMGLITPPTMKINPNAGSSKANYTEVSFADLAHSPQSNRKTA